MASNAELAASIAALDESAVTDGLNNAQLSTLLKSLKADEEAAAKAKADEEAAAKAKADEEAAAKVKADEEAAAKAKAVVAPGKAITSKRGILGPGEEVGEDDVNDLAKLKERGIVK